jgi:replication factor A2
MLIIYCLRTLTRCDLQFSSTTEGAHYDAIAGQLKIPTDKLKSLSLNHSLSLSLSLSLTVLLEENVLTPSSLVFDREVLQVLVDNGLVYTTINDDYYKSTVNA